jgi:ribosomal protein S27AE
MGAFNRLTIKLPCPNCRAEVILAIQFKYGDTWQRDYDLGETLCWGGNDIGTPGRQRVVVDGVGEACPKCGSSGHFDVFIERDVIVRAEPRSGRFDFVGRKDPFIILE